MFQLVTAFEQVSSDRSMFGSYRDKERLNQVRTTCPSAKTYLDEIRLFRAVLGLLPDSRSTSHDAVSPTRFLPLIWTGCSRTCS
jgi:hypothetical protein